MDLMKFGMHVEPVNVNRYIRVQIF